MNKTTLKKTLSSLIFSFTILELVILGLLIYVGDKSQIYRELRQFDMETTWPWSIVVGCLMVDIGLIFDIKSRYLPPLPSSGQALNSIAWSLAGFLHLIVGNEFSVSMGFFCLAIVNVVLAVTIEVYGHVPVNQNV